MVEGKYCLFSIGNGAEIWPLEMGRKSFLFYHSLPCQNGIINILISPTVLARDDFKNINFSPL